MFSLTLNGAPDSAGGPQVISTLCSGLLGVFTHALENIDIQESSRYDRPWLEKLPSAGGGDFHIAPSGVSHLTSALPLGSSLVPLPFPRRNPSWFLAFFCCQSGSRNESAINSPCKQQLNLHSLSTPTLPFSALHFFRASFFLQI